MRLLPKLPMLNTSGSNTAGLASSMQYPKAELEPPDAAAEASSARNATPSGDNAAEHPQQLKAEGIDESSNVAELLQPVGPCPICSSSEILVPFVAHPCRHIFCYYCLQSHCAADSEFQCPVDSIRVDALQRYVRTVPPAPS